MSPWQWGRGSTARLTDYPLSVLALVDERQGGRFCVACREASVPTPADEPLEIDHIRPLSRGGDNHWSNLRWLCRSHNRGRGNRVSPPRIPRHARGRRD